MEIMIWDQSRHSWHYDLYFLHWTTQESETMPYLFYSLTQLYPNLSILDHFTGHYYPDNYRNQAVLFFSYPFLTKNIILLLINIKVNFISLKAFEWTLIS